MRNWYPNFDRQRHSTGFRALAARHIGHCPDCQEHFEVAAELEKRLRREAHRRVVAPSAGLEARILAAVLPGGGTATTRATVERKKSTGWWMIVAGTVVGAAAVAVLVMFRPPAGPGDFAREDAPAPEMSEEAFATLESFPGRVWEEIAPRAAQVAGEDPLGREMAAVRSDTRSALRFLAMNFLPEATVEQVVPATGADDSST